MHAPIANAKAEAEWFYEDPQDLLELTPKKDVLFIIGKLNEKVGSQEISGVIGKFGLGVQNCSLLLLLLLSRFSCVQLCATPERAAHQISASLGFSRQEHWSGLSFPSPMHESEKWKWSRSVYLLSILAIPWGHMEDLKKKKLIL